MWLIADLAEHLGSRLGVPTTLVRFRALLNAGRRAAAHVHARLKRAAPRIVARVEDHLRRAGRPALILACLAAALFPVAVAGLRMYSIAAERGRYLWYPAHWDATSRAPAVAAGHPAASGNDGMGRGGASEPVYPLRLMSYTVKPGDTLSGIATAFGLTLDTVSSLNRVLGNGVHVVSVGEKLKIPNQDGIYLAVSGSLEDTAKKYNLLPDTVLAINEMSAPSAIAGLFLFFPVQHTGSELAIIQGNAFFFPLLGWWGRSSEYGYRKDPFDPAGGRRMHYGIDFVSSVGAPVRAARGGKVWIATYDDVFGNQVLIAHESGYSTFYAHLQRSVVKPGQIVSNQDIIGYLGGTGHVTGPHLHFEIRRNGFPINPAGLLAYRP